MLFRWGLNDMHIEFWRENLLENIYIKKEMRVQYYKRFSGKWVVKIRPGLYKLMTVFSGSYILIAAIFSEI
jgi:hypothetical protein